MMSQPPLPGFVDPVRVAMERGGLAESTHKRYRHAGASWKTYCGDRGIDAAGANEETLCRWLDARSKGRELASVYSSLSAARHVQRQELIASPRPVVPYTRGAMPGLDNWLSALERERGVASSNAAAPITHAELTRMMRALGRRGSISRRAVNTERAFALAQRDACLLSFGWWGLFRRSELAALTIEDVNETVTRDGLPVVIVRVTRSKTDQKGKGHTVAMCETQDATCPVAAYHRWRAVRVPEDAPREDDRRFFLLKGDGVADVVRRSARLVGLARSAHGLRHGFAAEAAALGLDSGAAMRHGRWQSWAAYARYLEGAEVVGAGHVTALLARKLRGER